MFKTNIKLYKYNLDKIIEINNENNLSSSRRNVKNTNKFDSDTVEKIINEIIIKLELPENNGQDTAWLLVAAVLQLGGSNQKAGNSISYTVNNFTLTSQQLNNIVKKITKSGTNRQLARSISDNIAEIATHLNIPGDLHSQILLEHPDLTNYEKVWCSNFQTQNPNCPERVREWLVNNFKSRFNR